MPSACDAAATSGGWYRCGFSDGCSIVLSPSCAQLQFTNAKGDIVKQMLRHSTSITRPYLVAALRLRNAFVHPPVCCADILPFMDNAIFRAPPQLCKVYWPSSSSSPLVVSNADGSVTVTSCDGISRICVHLQTQVVVAVCPHLLPGECRHIGSPRAPVAPIEPSVPLAFMCPLLAPEATPHTSSVSSAVGDDDFLSDGRSSFAWQVSVFSAASAPSEFTHALSLATSRASTSCATSQSHHVSASQPSTISAPLPCARSIPTRPNATDKFHSAPDNRVFSSLLGQGVACQWTASSALTFISPPNTPEFAAGVFFDGTAFSLTQEDVLSWFRGSSVRACIVGAIPPSHRLELGSCCRPLTEVITELRCNILHSRSIMLSSHAALQPQQHLRPVFSAVVVERLHVKEIGEFILYEDHRARAFFVDCTICELSQGAGVQVTDAGGFTYSLTCSNRGAFDWHIEQLLTFAEWASMDEESRVRDNERRRQVFEATELGVRSINNTLRLLAVRSAAAV